MKQIIIYIAILLSSIIFLSSCNDDFMEKIPQTDLVDSDYWKTPQQLRYVANTLYPSYIQGHQSEWATDYNYPMASRGSHLMYGDALTDNGITLGSESDRLNGKFITPASGTGTCWNWTDMRTINYFLTRYSAAYNGSKLNDKEVDEVLGEVYFFKAWDYYLKVRALGDVPWLTKDLNTNSPELMNPRDPRAQVMDSVLMCINKAVSLLPEKGKEAESGRLNKDHANFLKSRICLYEGTYRKYHTELNLTSTANNYLEECVVASQALISSGRYALYNDGSNNAYWKMFAMKDNQADNNKEVILARKYLGGASVYGHASQRYFEYNSVANYTRFGATRGFVDEFLCIDGKPIYLSGSKGNYVKNPNFLGYGKWTELENRDPRLTQIICKPGEYLSIYQNGNLTKKTTYFNVSYNSTSSLPSYTGYRVIKHWMGNKSETDAYPYGTQVGIEFRYAEILLNYIEAQYELGKVTQTDVDLTINKLRERAGFDFVKYPTSKLDLANIPDDPRLDAIYREKLQYPVSPLLREIRRERRVELGMEDRRYEDLMRWKAGPLLTVPLRGVNFMAIKNLYDGTLNNANEFAPKVELNKDVFVDDEGFLIGYPKSANITNGILPWSDHRYYFPIPKDQITLNPKLVQNPGWD